MLLTKCIFSPREESDGLRVSVMSRHTLNDGVTPDKRIVAGEAYDVGWHLHELSPGPKAVGAWYRSLAELERKEKEDLTVTRRELQLEKNTLWARFQHDYLERLEDPQRIELQVMLANRAMEGNVTLLCVEETPEYCHRLPLAENIRRLHPGLEIRHV